VALTSGSRLGPYEIVCAIGAGGMGEVYRARDTRLNRDVAIKVLPPLFASDPDRLSRFEREAQVLAALNHPHIAHVYGVEEAPGGRALVMEFVDGEDLARRLTRGPVPVDDALAIARQIADALEAAHERGVIHRDLKPANVKLSEDGSVKVLDFGLAKALDPSSSSAAHLLNSPTLTSPATMAGVVLGTAAYMAPEQAKGKAVDKRADIWAFGVLLYEMLTGARLFEGETIIETMGLVATRAVELSRLPAATPPRIRELLQRCLDKDPKNRLRDIGEARIALTKAIAGEADAAAPASPSRAAPARWAALTVCALVAGVAAGAATWWWTSSRAPQLPHRRFVLPAPVVGGPSGSRDFAISPDGRAVVYATGGKLHVWELNALRPRELKGAGETGAGEAAPAPFWSPDSRFVGYSARGRLWRIGAQDGEAVAICDIPGAIVGGAWLGDGTIVFATTRGPMFQVAAAGGESKVLIPLAPGDIDFHQPTVLPDARSIVYALHGPGGTDTIEVFSSGTRKTVLRYPQKARGAPQVFNHPVYSPTGHIVYRLDEGNLGLWAVPFSLTKLAATGEPFLIAPGGRDPAVAGDGTLIYAPTADSAPGQLVWVGLDGSVSGALGTPRHGIDAPALSPDGTRVAFSALENNNSDIWVVDAAGLVRITATPQNEVFPQWTRDGRSVVFSCPVDNTNAVCARKADGSGETRVLAKNGDLALFAPDGRTAVYRTNGSAERGLKILDLQTGVSRPYLLGTFELTPMGFAADGRYLAYNSFRSGAPRIYVRQYPSGDGEWEIPELNSERVAWPRGGRELFAVLGSARETPVVALTIDTAGTPKFGKPRMLFSTTADKLALLGGFDAPPDGRRFLTIQPQKSATDLSGIVVVQNWFAEFMSGR
jgi:eukaryotic-like serine/threonine-protein kinase